VPPPQPSAAQAWQVVAPELDQAWGHDTPLTVTLLDAYVARYPDDPVATEKLYAALIARGRDLATTGQIDEGAAQLMRAEQLLPNRLEARLALDALRSSPAQ
jgi:hypothetical protein